MNLIRISMGLITGFVFLFGVWLLYWNPVDFATKVLDYGIWDWGILLNGLPSIIVGAVICVISAYYGVKMLFGG